MRHGLTVGMRRKGGLGFLPFGPGPTVESEFLAGLQLDGKTVYDIGGFEGLLTLFFARRAAAVVTYEPAPANFRRCGDNVRLNGLTAKVTLINRGLSDCQGSIDLVCDPLMPGAGSGNSEISSQIESSTTAARKVTVPVVTLDAEISDLNLPAPDFIKIDIEGMELPALRGMANTLESRSPDLFVELHGAEPEDKMRNTLGVLRFLEGAGYRAYDVENRVYVASSAPPSHPPSHVYCTRRR